MEYIYKIRRTSAVTINGLGETLTAHVLEYAYKPYWLGWEADALNRKLRFQTGIHSCEAAWKRHGDRPELVLYGDPKNVKTYAGGYGDEAGGTELYVIPAEKGVRGSMSDYTLFEDCFLLGWVFRNHHGELILQYRQLDADEDDPREGREDLRHACQEPSNFEGERK